MKRLIAVLLLVILTATSALYLIPTFNLNYQGKQYSFKNLPSALNTDVTDLRLRIPRVTPTYTYEIISAAKLDKREDWNNLSSSDQKILAQRLDSVLGGAYEIRLDNKDGKVAFEVFTNKKISNPTLLTEPNAGFLIQAVSSSTVTTSTGETPSESKVDLPLKRDDFGFAEVVSAAGTSGQTTYAVRLPLGILITPEKITTIKNNLISQLSVNIAGTSYQASFDYNTTGTPTHLLVYAGTTVEDAALLKAFVNTQPLNLGYELKNTSYNSFDNMKYVLAGLVLLILLAGYLINKYSQKNLSAKKILIISSIVIITLAAFKLLNVTLTLAPLLILTTVISLTFFNLKPIYYIVFWVLILLLKLLGLLNGFDISWLGLMITIISSILIWFTNYVELTQKENK